MTKGNKQKETNVAIYARVSTVGKGKTLTCNSVTFVPMPPHEGFRSSKNTSMTAYRAVKTNVLPSIFL